jgi:tetratricopeptide (TPR) repeat protein
MAAERRGRFEEAIGAYRAAAAFASTAGPANSRLGHLLLNLGRPQLASQALRAAAKADPQNPERRMDLVRALMVEKKDAEAEAEVRGALEADPANADGHWLLGRILAEAGRFQEARAAFEASLAQGPGQAAIYYDLVRSYRLGEADRPLVSRMLALSRNKGGGEAGIRLQFALGKAFDDLGDCAAAMRCFGKGAELRAALAPFDRNGFVHRVDRLIERFTPELLASSAAAQGGGGPIFVVGMPRSGTTLVEQILSAHLAVEGAGELAFWPSRGPAFERVTDQAEAAAFLRQAGRECLETLAAQAPGAPRVVDKNPFNFLWAGLIHMALPQAIIVHCRRDPIDTCLSIHATWFAPRTDFPTGLDDLAFYYRCYARLMRHWRAALPPERFVELDYEALVSEPEAEVRALLDACGLGWDEACLHPERNRRVLRTASRWQARQPISAASVGRWRRYAPWLGALSGLEQALGSNS